MPIDRKALRERVKAAKEKQVEETKKIVFPLPDLRGPGGNAFVLLGEAHRLMKDNGISNAVHSVFHAEATSGDYEVLLRTIQKWFTVAVADTQYVPLPENIDIVSMRPSDEDGYENWEEYDAAQPQAPDDVNEQLEAMEQNDEEVRKQAEKEKRVIEQLRAELGLDPEDVVLVQIKRVKK